MKPETSALKINYQRIIDFCAEKGVQIQGKYEQEYAYFKLVHGDITYIKSADNGNNFAIWGDIQRLERRPEYNVSVPNSNFAMKVSKLWPVLMFIDFVSQSNVKTACELITKLYNQGKKLQELQQDFE